jgi:hypothetical protein
MYLPLLGGGHEGRGSEGRGLPGGGLAARRKGPPAASAPGKKGLSYPGPQRILSDFLKPTNRSQTLLQPALANPPVLPPPLSLPNIVQMADAGPAPKKKPYVPVVKTPEVIKPAQPPEPAPPAATLAMPAPVDEPKMIQPASIPKVGPLPEIKYPESTPSLKPPEQVTPSPAPEDAKVSPPPEPPPMPPEPISIDPPAKVLDEPAEVPRREFSPLPTRGNDVHNLLALSPMPTVRQQPFEVPVGEARGRFAISPEANLATSETEPGPQLETSASAIGVGIHTASATGNGDTGGGGTEAGTGAGTGSGSGGGTGSGVGSGPGSGPGPGVGSGSGRGSGSGPGSIAGSGSGTGMGTGSGRGSGTGTGTGTGAGAGPGKGPFAGISIIGGVADTGAAAAASPAPRTPPKRPLQSAYGITIISTENSGGGLPPFGVFAREQVYTVYLDMRRDETDSSPSWTLEFAVPQGAPGQIDVGVGSSQQGLVLPFPVTKDPPVLPAELVRKYVRRMMIVYSVVNIEGKLEQISVKESPDVLLNDPVVTALSKWTFRPARLHGDPVPAKVLMGIPLWVPE